MQISEFDTIALLKIRANIEQFLARCGQQYSRAGAMVLDVAPQDHRGAAPHFQTSTLHTLDINPLSGATYVADLCASSTGVPHDSYDYVVCTEVLEHTLQPFTAVGNLRKLLKPGGLIFVTTPFNFRIHGPLPDCWRFTEHGLRALFHDYEILELSALECERFLMPIQYSLIARRPR